MSASTAGDTVTIEVADDGRGVAGRGFAVVAEEIRNLADRAAKATADIAAIIKGLQEVAREAVSATNESVRIADESSTLAESGAGGLKKILTGLADITGVVSQIARATVDLCSKS